jgi:hypothetical protein
MHRRVRVCNIEFENASVPLKTRQKTGKKHVDSPRKRPEIGQTDSGDGKYECHPTRTRRCKEDG